MNKKVTIEVLPLAGIRISGIEIKFGTPYSKFKDLVHDVIHGMEDDLSDIYEFVELGDLDVSATFSKPEGVGFPENPQENSDHLLIGFSSSSRDLMMDGKKLMDQFTGNEFDGKESIRQFRKICSNSEWNLLKVDYVKIEDFNIRPIARRRVDVEGAEIFNENLKMSIRWYRNYPLTIFWDDDLDSILGNQ